jgi:hypothetical protein
MTSSNSLSSTAIVVAGGCLSLMIRCLRIGSFLWQAHNMDAGWIISVLSLVEGMIVVVAFGTAGRGLRTWISSQLVRSSIALQLLYGRVYFFCAAPRGEQHGWLQSVF